MDMNIVFDSNCIPPLLLVTFLLLFCQSLLEVKVHKPNNTKYLTWFQSQALMMRLIWVGRNNKNHIIIHTHTFLATKFKN